MSRGAVHPGSSQPFLWGYDFRTVLAVQGALRRATTGRALDCSGPFAEPLPDKRKGWLQNASLLSFVPPSRVNDVLRPLVTDVMILDTSRPVLFFPRSTPRRAKR